MKHHFADLLDRNGNYWTIVPNIERYSFTLDEKIEDVENAKIVTIGKEHTHWRQIFELPNLEELTLHQPSKDQLETISELKHLLRLRISHTRPKNIDFIKDLSSLEECVFEYVSGFSDLTPFSQLKKIKSLHFENLRKVRDFSGLSGLESLRYLHIDGTLDWNQPIEDFSFLTGLPNLEVFALGFITNKSEFPAFLSVLNLKKLKRIKIGTATLKTNEYAFLETALPNVKCGPFGGGGWKPYWECNGYFELLGKGLRSIKCSNPKAKEKCNDFSVKYKEMRLEAGEIIKAYQLKG